MRRFLILSLLAVAMATVLLFTCVSCQKSEQGTADAKSSERKLYIYNWTYYTPDNVVEMFEKEFDCEVIFDYFASNEEMFAKVQAGGGSGYDLIIPSADYTQIMINLGMCEEMDHSKLGNLQYLSDLAKEKNTFDPEMKYSVPYFLGAPGISVNKAKAPATYSHDWDILTDPAFNGKMSMLDSMRDIIGAALLYLGYSDNSTDDAELAEATALVNSEWKQHLVKFDSEGFGKAFSRGEFIAVHGFAEGVFGEVPEEEWDNIDFFIPESGSTIYLDSFVIPKGARHKDLAMEFINFFHRPEIYALFLDAFHFPATVNSEAEQYMTVTPFYDEADLESSELLLDVGADLQKYVTNWESIRYNN